jgi:hypothetical protein
MAYNEPAVTQLGHAKDNDQRLLESAVYLLKHREAPCQLS